MDTSTLGTLCAVGILGLGAFGAMLPGPQDKIQEVTMERLKSVFLVLGLALIVTAVAATLAFNSGFPLVLFMAQHTLGGFGTLFVSVIPTMSTLLLTLSIDGNKRLLKLACFSLFNAAIGLSISPLLFLGGDILTQAALLTFLVVGTLAYIGVCARSQAFYFLAGPLSIGLLFLSIMSLGASWFPDTYMNVSLYGGLALFSAYVLYDANVIATKARHSYMFDPVRECLDLYLDAINIFVRIAIFLAKSQKEERKGGAKSKTR